MSPSFSHEPASHCHFDARLSATYPTVELRSADVCRRPEDTILVAALARGLVETASREWKIGREPQTMPSSLLRLASWRAGRSGLEADLVHPHSARPVPAQVVLAALLGHVGATLSDLGDLNLVEQLRQDYSSAAMVQPPNGPASPEPGTCAPWCWRR